MHPRGEVEVMQPRRRVVIMVQMVVQVLMLRLLGWRSIAERSRSRIYVKVKNK
jgi:hypothetical protein